MTSTASAKRLDSTSLDDLTGGAFSAPTSGERTARVRAWLATEPSSEQMNEVFKELSVKDKGAAKPLKEKLDDIKRARGQEAVGLEWAVKAQALLDTGRLNVADAMAWQRDAAKAGAPLSREPLAALKVQLTDRVKVIEDLQHRVQVQREAAVLLAQRIEVLSTKSWRDAQTVWEPLGGDVAHWQVQADTLLADSNWASVDAKFPPLLEAARSQLVLVWEAFNAALGQAVAAAADAQGSLPSVPVWADELRLARGIAVEEAAPPKKPKIDPAERAAANASVQEVLDKLELEITQGHGKASAGAAAALRNAIKEHGRLIDSKLDGRAHAALAAAGELEGWQRWRADQLRQELVTAAEGLLKRPAGQAMGGRKLQENLRNLREQWKQTDKGGTPNQALWKRFDEACSEAYTVVQAWLDKIKAEAAENKAARLALIEELKAWAAANTTALDDDWKGFGRVLHQFADRWRDGGHLGEKAFAEMQPLWKAAMDAASAPLEALQKQSLLQRQAMIDEAELLGAAPMLRIDAVKALQQRWQAEAHAVPLERRQEQKLWDAFRKPIDDAFNRKTQEREKFATAMSEHDRVVLQAAQALEAANAQGDAQAIRAAMQGLEAATRNRAGGPVAATAPPTLPAPTNQATDVPASAAATQAEAETAEADAAGTPAVTEQAPKPAPRKPVVAVRGDDRPGMKKAEPAPPGRFDRAGGARDGGRGGPAGARGAGARGDDRSASRDAPRRSAARDGSSERDAPRLGDAAFRAQRDALEHAQLALKKLAVQAHGESLTHVLGAWQQRDVAQLPSGAELGGQVTSAMRSLWVQTLSSAGSGDAAAVLLRLEIAAEVPSPAAQSDARRAMQLQLLTKRNEPAPAQTWGQDVARVLATPFEDAQGRRLQNVLKVFLRR